MPADCSLTSSSSTGGRHENSGWVARLERLVQGQLFVTERQAARARLCPDMSYGRHFAPPGPTAKPAAVMILLEQPRHGADWRDCHVPLTVRPLYLSDHPGQISLPGGRLEQGETYQEAAEREFLEEMGIASFPGKIIGSLLSMWVFNSNYCLTPFLAVHTGNIEYSPCVREVSRLIRLPVTELLKVGSPLTSRFGRGKVNWKAGVFQYEQDYIWGATAMILAELAAVLQMLDQME